MPRMKTELTPKEQHFITEYLTAHPRARVWRPTHEHPGTATEAHHLHLENLKGKRSMDQVKEYIAEVHRTEGPFYAKWLRDDYAAWRMESRK